MMNFGRLVEHTGNFGRTQSPSAPGSRSSVQFGVTSESCSNPSAGYPHFGNGYLETDDLEVA